MKIFKLTTVKAKLVFAFSILILLICILTSWSVINIQRIINYQSLSSQYQELNLLVLQMKNSETSFLKFGQINPEFYDSGVRTDLDHLNHKGKQALALLESLEEESRRNLTLKIETNINQSKEFLSNYIILVKKLEAKIKKRGFKDWGVIGELRKIIHQVEHAKYEYNKADMLMLRRHEKDFLLRKDLKYLTKFKKQIQTFKSNIVSTVGEENEKNNILFSIDEYQKKFEKVVHIQEEIGLNPTLGILGEINQLTKALENNLSQVAQDVMIETNQKVESLIFNMLIGLTTLIILFIILVRRMIIRLSKPIMNVRLHLDNMSRGIVPDMIDEKSNDVILNTINESLNNIIKRLRNITTFVSKIGKEEYSADIQILNEKDELGKQLNIMKDNLITAKENQEERSYEESKRKWLSEGVANLSGLLRENNVNTQTLCDNLLTNLVKYLDVNQGAIFLYDEKSNDLKLTSAYAYNRKKYIDRAIQPGEGLIGEVFLEKEKIYRTDIPQGHFYITSGLGESTPTSLLIAPLLNSEEKVLGIIELASFKGLDKYELELIDRVTSAFSSALNISRINSNTKKFLEESQEMSQKLKIQEEQMRQNIEELTATQEELLRKENEYLLQIDSLKDLIEESELVQND